MKLLRPELAAIPHTLSLALVRRQFWGMFGRPERLHPTVADVAVQEFVANYRNPRGAHRLFGRGRNIYLEEPDGPNGFWTRLSGLEPPAMFIWGDEDPLVPLAFCAYVSEALPEARQVVLNACGHVPQVELPEDTNGLIHDFIASAPAKARVRAVAHIGRAARRLREAGEARRVHTNGNGSAPQPNRHSSAAREPHARPKAANAPLPRRRRSGAATAATRRRLPAVAGHAGVR